MHSDSPGELIFRENSPVSDEDSMNELIYQENYNYGTSANFTTEKLVHTHMTSSSEDMQRLQLEELTMIKEILQKINKDDLELQLER